MLEFGIGFDGRPLEVGKCARVLSLPFKCKFCFFGESGELELLLLLSRCLEDDDDDDDADACISLSKTLSNTCRAETDFCVCIARALGLPCRIFVKCFFATSVRLP